MTRLHKMKSKGIVENTAFSSVEKAVQIIAGLFVVPYILVHVGITVYGTWVLFGSIASCFMLAQFGLSASFEKFIAELRIKKDFTAICTLISTAFFSLFLLGIIISVAGLILSPILVNIFFPHQDVEKTATSLSVFISISMTLPSPIDKTVSIYRYFCYKNSSYSPDSILRCSHI